MVRRGGGGPGCIVRAFFRLRKSGLKTLRKSASASNDRPGHQYGVKPLDVHTGMLRQLRRFLESAHHQRSVVRGRRAKVGPGPFNTVVISFGKHSLGQRARGDSRIKYGGILKNYCCFFRVKRNFRVQNTRGCCDGLRCTWKSRRDYQRRSEGNLWAII